MSHVQRKDEKKNGTIYFFIKQPDKIISQQTKLNDR